MKKNNSSDTKIPESETFIDFKISIQLFKSNIRVYLPFLLGILLVFVLRSFVFIYVSFAFFSAGFVMDTYLIIKVLQHVADLLLFSLILCIGYGLANDIMSSGDGFTFIKSIFTYSWKYFIKFLLLTAILYLPYYLLEITVFFGSLDGAQGIILFYPLVLIAFSLLWFVFFIETGPLIITNKSFFNSIKKNFRIFAKNKVRIFKTWIIFWCVFFLPELILLPIPYTIPIGVFNFGPYFSIISLITDLPLLQKLFQIIFGYPFMALLATRINISGKITLTE